ncbi:hypothetical protein BKA80DRAFT_269470 [Phyllosticta citrichinensis]
MKSSDAPAGKTNPKGRKLRRTCPRTARGAREIGGASATRNGAPAKPTDPKLHATSAANVNPKKESPRRPRIQCRNIEAGSYVCSQLIAASVTTPLANHYRHDHHEPNRGTSVCWHRASAVNADRALTGKRRTTSRDATHRRGRRLPPHSHAPRRPATTTRPRPTSTTSPTRSRSRAPPSQSRPRPSPPPPTSRRCRSGTRRCRTCGRTCARGRSSSRASCSTWSTATTSIS